MPSGLLHDENVIFYHPVDNVTEYTRNLDWDNIGDDFDFIPSILTSGIRTTTGDSIADLIYTPGTPYTTLLNASGATCAFWASGFLGGDSDGRQIYIGFANTSNSFSNGFWLEKTSISSGFRTIAEVNNVIKVTDWFPPPSNDNDWHLFVLDMRYETSGWRHRISLDGSGWIDLGVDDNTNVFSSDPRPYIRVFDHTTSPKIPLDEIVLWGDNDLFTDQELSNLYELYNTYNTTMDQYIITFPTPASSGTDLFIHGDTQTSGNISLYIPGQVETKLMNLFTSGAITSGTTSSNTTNFIQGHQVSSSDIDQYIQGFELASGNMDLYISGIPFISSSVNLYIMGPLQINSNIDNFITGHLSTSGSSTLFIKGLFPRFDGFVSVAANNPSNNFDLSIYGVPSGAPTIFNTNKSATLFINDAGDDNTVDSAWSAFAKVDNALTVDESSTWQSFVRGGNTSNNNINLYIGGHASGEAPHGLLISGSVSVLIIGQSAKSGEEGLLSDGYYASNTETPAFTKVHLGLSNTSNLYTSGDIGIVSVSSELDLFTFGILGIVSNSYTMCVFGLNSVNNSCDLFIFGIQDIESNNATLYIEVTNIGLFNRSSTMYSHGF